MAKVSSSFTIMDYTDGISLITGIDSNLPLTQTYDSTLNQHFPSWGASALVLTPKVQKAGSSTNLVSQMTTASIHWFRRYAGSDWVEIISGSSNESIGTEGVLTVNANKLTDNYMQMDYKFEGVYHDPTLNLNFPVSIVTSFSRVNNGTSFVIANAYAPSGNMFKNFEPASLPIKCDLIRGGHGKDSSVISYKWQNSTNGVDWVDIAGTTDTLTVTQSMVDNFAVFRCVVRDYDENNVAMDYTSEGVPFYDYLDELQCRIDSTAGNYFKKGEADVTVLVTRIHRNGVELDPTGTDSHYSYVWKKTDKDGNVDNSFTAVKTTTTWDGNEISASRGKAIAITSTDVEVKSNYFVEVTENL